jgi:hypothetical protein
MWMLAEKLSRSCCSLYQLSIKIYEGSVDGASCTAAGTLLGNEAEAAANVAVGSEAVAQLLLFGSGNTSYESVGIRRRK